MQQHRDEKEINLLETEKHINNQISPQLQLEKHEDTTSVFLPKQVIFSNRAFTSLLAETKEKIKTETGGIFIGIMCNDTWYVIEAIDPGPKSIFQPAYFEYDGDYVRHLANKVNRLYGDKLDVLGLWHRHPGSMDTFSGTDDGTIKQFAQQNNGVTISALVNIDPVFRLTMYRATLNPFSYRKISYLVDDDKIPQDVKNVLPHNEIETQINTISSNRHVSPAQLESRRISTDFHAILIKYLNTAEYFPIANGAFFENSEEDYNQIIEDYLVDECLFCDDNDIPYVFEKKKFNEVELLIGDENYGIKFSFFNINFKYKNHFFSQNPFEVIKRFFSTSELEMTSGKKLCFIHNGKLFLYKGNLLKNAWEEYKK